MSYEMRRLLEAVEELNEAWVEHRDPGGHFQVVYEPPRGYFVIARNDLPDISGESFDDLEDAIEHAHDQLGIDYLDEDFAEEPIPYDEFHMGSILDREEMPAIPMRLKALDDVPMLYMKKGDEMWVKPTNIMGEVYSEENGLTYDWDSIFHMYERGALEIIPDENEFNEPGEMEPYIEEDTLDNAVVAPLENVMRLAQNSLTSMASEFADSAEFVKRRYPEHREEYNMLVDIERELDELRRRIFEIR
jgi:hypothetical protein